MASDDELIGGSYVARLTVTQIDQDVPGNRSKIRRTLQGVKTAGSGYWTNTAQPWSISGDGGSKSGSATYDYRDYTTKTFYQDEVWIGHNSDGTKTVSVSANLRMDSPPGGLGTPSVSLTLTTIPRTSEPSVSGGITLSTSSGSLTVNTNRKSSSFTHTLTWKFGSKSGTIATGVGASTTWSLDSGERDSILRQLPNSTFGTGTITCKTYSGGKLVGTDTCPFSVTVASSVVPSVSTLSLSEAVASVASGVGAYVQGQSRLNFAVSGAAGVAGSSIKSTVVTLPGMSYSATSGTTGVLTAAGTVTVTATVTDSRGRKASKSVPVTVLAWGKPKITKMRVDRAQSDGTLDDNGQYLKFTVTATVSSLVVGSQKNTLKYQAKVKGRSASSWLSSTLTTASGTTLNASFVMGTFAETLAWDVRFEVQDRFTAAAPSASQSIVGVGAVLVELAKSGVSFGKRYEHGAVDVRGDVYIDGRLNATHNAWAESGGSASFADIPAGSVGSVSVTFPAGRFTVAPIIGLTANTSIPKSRSVGIGSPSAAGFTINQNNDTGSASAAGVHWTAKQMTPTSAGG